MSAPVTKKHFLNDPKRLSTLERLDLLSPTPSDALNRLTRLAAALMQAPIAMVSIVDDHRQFYKSVVGLPDVIEAPLSHSFCQHVVTSGEPLIVSDSRLNDITKDNLAIRDLQVIAYAGMPMISSDGQSLGSFCVLDHKPRQWTATELGILEDLRGAAMVEIELREVTAQLGAEQAFRDGLTSLLVHDFKTPLTSILVAAETAQEDPGSVGEMLSIISSNAQRMQVLTNDLLDVSRFEHGEIRINAVQFDFAKLVTEAIRDVTPIAKEVEVRIEARIPVELPMVKGDRVLISRLLTNLLSNALRYTTRGTDVTVVAEQVGDRIKCSVIDNGPGIPTEMTETIFAKYGRVEGAKQNYQAPSTGLGLTFCKMCVNAHGGEIGVDSELGRGSTFWFTLPTVR
ncbi:MAG: GAF domain-containing sensor histidine kinase [Armatimonadetes bacterium]|nr:GAF domain-containing sensor histidine kinase [Armatimonadota bacterium]